ncbi:MAG: glycosyl hydrolase [Planctomycetota bacterium]
MRSRRAISMRVPATILPLLTLALAPSSFAGNPLEEHATTLAAVEARFADPPASYRPAPLWVWNDDLQEQELALQIEELARGGFGGVFIHPRPGLVTPYLSDRWLRLWRFSVEECKRHSMVVHIYDENSYPSGFAGGHVPDTMPESRQVILRHELFEPDRLQRLQADSNSVALYRLVTPIPATFERIALPPLAPGKVRSSADLGLQRATYLFYTLTYGQPTTWLAGKTFVDLLRPGVGEKFLDITFGAYDKILTGEYGKTVLSCFTDEPHVTGAWTPSLPDLFKAVHGYDLLDHLPSLHMDIGDWRRARHDYASTLLHLYTENFVKPYARACEERGIVFTGHVWEHEWPNAAHGADVMSFNAWQQMPGIDCLMNQYSEDMHAQFGNWRAVAEIRSIANQLGRIRTLCESYGASGWDVAFQDLKRIADWLLAGGVNLLNPHLSYYTIRGSRKADHPPSFSYHEPWWEAHHVLADYCGRLSWALASGWERNDILVIEPTTTMWLYNWSDGSRTHLEELGAAFQSFVTELAAAQVAFDLGSEPVMKSHARVTRGKLQIGACSYSTVILPPGLENLESATLELLEKLLAEGGRVVTLAGIPPYRDGRTDHRAAALPAKGGPRWVALPSSAAASPSAAVLPVLGKPQIVLEVTVAPKAGRIFHRVRELEDGWLLFLINTSLEEEARVQATAPSASVTMWDALDGHTSPVAAALTPPSPSGVRVRWDVRLPPTGSTLFALAKGEAPAAAAGAEAAPGARQVLMPEGPLSIRPLEPNVLPLDFADLVLGGATTPDLYRYDAQNRIYQFHGLERNPWDRAVQFKDELLKKDSFPPDSGFELRYHFAMSHDAAPPDSRLVVERGDRYEVRLNDRTLEPAAGEWWLDRAFTVYRIDPSWLRFGDNVIATRARPFSIHHEPEPVYLVGSFSLRPAERGFVIEAASPLELGSWAKQGWPFYPGPVAYSREFRCEPGEARYVVALSRWTGTAAQVLVNGKLAGTVGWPPFEADITSHVESGVNTVSVIVYGSLKNLLGPHHRGAVRGTAWPGHFLHAWNGPPPAGDAYDVIDYGFGEPFLVLAQ